MSKLPRLPTVEHVERAFEQEHRFTEEALRKLTDEELRKMERLLEPLSAKD